MRTWLTKLAIVLLTLAATTGAATAAEASRRVYVIPIREEIDSSTTYLVRRGVKEAMANKADLIVFDMNTPGGSAQAMMDIIDIINQFKGDTVAYVDKDAYSAGALICFATKKIYMAPASAIGAATPVQLAPGGTGIEPLPDEIYGKLASAIAGKIRANAENNGYNPGLVDAMIFKDHPFKIGDKTLNETGPLTLSDTEAAREYGDPPKPLLSSGTIPTLNSMLEKLDYGSAVRMDVVQTQAEKIGAWVNAISPVLLIVGIIGIYLEVKMPGVVLPGIVAVIAFLLYFFGGYIAGLSGMEWVLVFIVGLALVISELFVHPGTILPGMLGFGLILIALIMAMADVYPGTPAIPTLHEVSLPLRNLAIAFGSSLIIILILAGILPKTSIYSRMVSQSASGDTGVMEQQKRQDSRIGQQGVAISNLRPGGKARFGEDILDVVTEGEMLAKGQTVRIIGHSGAEAVVEGVS